MIPDDNKTSGIFEADFQITASRAK